MATRRVTYRLSRDDRTIELDLTSAEVTQYESNGWTAVPRWRNPCPAQQADA